MSKRSVTIVGPEAEMLEALATSGSYASVNEAVADALELLWDRDLEEHEANRMLVEAAERGLADIEAGRFTTFSSPEDVTSYFRGRTRDILARHKRAAE